MMEQTYCVPLHKLAEEFDLTPIYQAPDYNCIQIMAVDLNRAGLQLSGFFEYFEPMRIQIIGLVETTYLQELTHEQRLIAFDRYFNFKMPALIIARDLQPLDECLKMAKKHGVTVLKSTRTTSETMSMMMAALRMYLAPRITRHGVLVDVYGEGLLLLGESGVGKSEAAVELIKRGHRLIADDAVEIRKISEKQLVGEAPELIRHYMEIRGIGVTNVAKLFGMGAVKESSNIDLVINIEPWSDEEFYDRLGLEDHMTDILGVQVPCLTIPVKPGRNLAVIVEVAAMNNRQKKMGYNPAREFTDQLNHYMDASM